MKQLEELRKKLEAIEQSEPQSIKETFEKMKSLAEVRKQIRDIEGGNSK